ncbi:MAG: 2-amino-4-hydroxy-6-hydroxymethyldihydropteridine diphosphokinase [Lacibacter sp.]
MQRHQAYLLTGSNLGNRSRFLQQAREAVATRVGKIVQASQVYETAAWGKEDQPPFLNQVLHIETALLPDALMEELLQIEQELGRRRTTPMAARTIDIDVLLYDNLRYQSARITIPHPSLHLRRFVLTPLAEIAPAKTHPVLRRHIRTLLQQCNDPLPVTVCND